MSLYKSIDVYLHTDWMSLYNSVDVMFTCTQTGCYVKGSSLALAHKRDATLKDLLLHLHTDGMLRERIFSCTCTQTGCYVKGSALALAHRGDATLNDFVLHSRTDGMLR